MLAYATNYIVSNKWNNISAYDLAAEIFFHAALHYNGTQSVAGMLSKVGGSVGAKAGAIAHSLQGGIDVENGRDRKKKKQELRDG